MNEALKNFLSGCCAELEKAIGRPVIIAVANPRRIGETPDSEEVEFDVHFASRACGAVLLEAIGTVILEGALDKAQAGTCACEICASRLKRLQDIVARSAVDQAQVGIHGSVH